MKILLVQIDGHKSQRGRDVRENPNLALMKLAHWHKAQGHSVDFTKRVDRQDGYDRVYASAIFKFSAPHQATFRANYPEAIIGGKHSGGKRGVGRDTYLK
jgi:threonyl-tRNA synthetase